MKVDKVNQFANGTRSKGHSAQGPRLNWLFYLPAPASRVLLCWLSKCLKYLGCLLLVLFRPVRPAAPHPFTLLLPLLHVLVVEVLRPKLLR